MGTVRQVAGENFPFTNALCSLLGNTLNRAECRPGIQGRWVSVLTQLMPGPDFCLMVQFEFSCLT